MSRQTRRLALVRECHLRLQRRAHAPAPFSPGRVRQAIRGWGRLSFKSGDSKTLPIEKRSFFVPIVLYMPKLIR
jgi:hypothetical protein